LGGNIEFVSLKSFGLSFVLFFIMFFLWRDLFDFLPADVPLVAVAGDCPLFLLICAPLYISDFNF
jgi:predicted membrane metal-binding protein